MAKDDMAWVSKIEWPDECRICGAKVDDAGAHARWHSDRGESEPLSFGATLAAAAIEGAVEGFRRGWRNRRSQQD